MKKYWYAVLMDAEDNDWGTGSYDLDEAKAMANKYEDGQIAVIDDGNDPICEMLLTKEDFWMDADGVDYAVNHPRA